MPKVDFKAYSKPTRQRMPSDLEIVVSVYGPYLTVKEIAECIKCDYQKALLLVNSGAIRSSRTGKNGGHIISAADLVSYIRENRKEIA